jgi:preprotein translocase subunit SecA
MPGILDRFLGDSSQREANKLRPLVAKINALEHEYTQLTNDELRAKTAEFRERIADGESLDSILPEAFAAVREAARRTIKQRHYDVQLLGGIVLHQGKIAEMRTGEGKTLVATLPLYLNALEGKGAHLVTPNDYLSRVGGGWMGPIYHLLGLSVGVIAHEYSAIYDPDFGIPGVGDERLRHWQPCQHRREAYLADITYGTNNEFGFDYLRDNMTWDMDDKRQRELNFAIVDEVDNILVDEARTPLIISGQPQTASPRYREFARLVRNLREGQDVTIDLKSRLSTLTDDGVRRLRSMGVPLPDLDNPEEDNPEQAEVMHHLEQALKAQFIFHRDKDYVVKDGEVIIVDEFTGRMMPGRRWSDGLHEAIEAKENVKMAEKTQTLATITFQNYFRMYKKLAGMTGTAMTESEEFFKIYRLDVVPIPTNKPMQRQDMTDQVYRTEEAKFRAVVTEIQESHERGRPVLVGTISVERSEHLAALLERAGVDHQVLNAKQHEREAQVIAQAGRPGMVTIATNMAGRGVDILLGGNPEGLVGEDLKRQGIDPIAVPTAEYVRMVEEKVKAVCQPDREKVLAQGGLHIIGTERHEARRIDNQLRGRAGRQGDPGSSRFFLSLEDELMRRAGGNTVSGLMNRLGMDEDVPIEAGLVAKVIESAQSKMEGYNFDIRKHVVQYDDVMNTQRTVIYGERIKVLESDDLRASILDMVGKELDRVVNRFAASNYSEEWDMDGLMRGLRAILPTKISEKDLAATARTELLPRLREEAEAAFAEMETQFNAIPIGDGEVFGITFGQQLLGATKKKPGPIMPQIERILLLGTIDHLWVEHLTILDDLREGIGLRAFGQKDPLVEYKNEAYGMFQELTGGIERTVARTAFHVGVVRAGPQATQRQISTNKDESGREPVRKTAVGVPPADGKMPKKAMCWCGSGKRFEDCHGRRDKQGKKLDVLAEPAAERVVSAPVAQARQQVNAWDKKGKKHKR